MKQESFIYSQLPVIEINQDNILLVDIQKLTKAVLTFVIIILILDNFLKLSNPK